VSVAPREIENAGSANAMRMLALARELYASPDERCVAALLAHELHQLFPIELAAVFLRGQDGVLRRAAARGRTELAAEVGMAAERALADGRASRRFDLHARAAESSARADLPDDVHVLTLALAPDGSLGMVALAVTGELRSVVDQEFLTALADVASSSIENLRLRERALEQAMLDHLTGLGNRRAFHQHLDALVSPPDRPSHAGEVTLVLFDIDDFKRVNDRFGHHAGDDVLRLVSRAILRAARSSEQVFRHGGDEFALVVHGRVGAGISAADRARDAVSSQRRSIPLPSLSAGVATFPDGADTRDGLLELADAALYAAKRAGKGQVVSFGRHGSLQPAE